LTFKTTGHIDIGMPRPSAREQIVQAGLKCLATKGFNGVGVQDITDTAGVPKGSFYNHFESKEALGAEIVDRYGADKRRRELLADKSIPPLERLRRHYERLITVCADAQFERGCILGNFSAELSNQSEVIRDSLRRLYERWTRDVEAAIAEAQEQGAVSKALTAAELAAFLLDAYEGALLRARVERDSRAFERFLKFAFSKLLV
jgi:TetR/AcrR family transcriptional regulator, transcriptional repressor for nem operon